MSTFLFLRNRNLCGQLLAIFMLRANGSGNKAGNFLYFPPFMVVYETIFFLSVPCQPAQTAVSRARPGVTAAGGSYWPADRRQPDASYQMFSILKRNQPQNICVGNNWPWTITHHRHIE